MPTAPSAGPGPVVPERGTGPAATAGVEGGASSDTGAGTDAASGADPEAADPAADPRYVAYPGSCHCGGVRFTASATRNLTVTLCNCGICFKSGHQELMIPEHRFELHQGQEFLKPYRFGTMVADHTFCVVCGIMPFYRPRSHPTGFFSVNARCLDLAAAEQIEYVEFDGQNWEASIAAGKHVLTE